MSRYLVLASCILFLSFTITRQWQAEITSIFNIFPYFYWFLYSSQLSIILVLMTGKVPIKLLFFYLLFTKLHLIFYTFFITSTLHLTYNDTVYVQYCWLHIILFTDYILCRLCGADLADAKSIINHLSPHASVIVNQTLFQRKGVEVQLLRNPLNIKFQSITLSNSKCDPVHNVSMRHRNTIIYSHYTVTYAYYFV